jgi:Tfp pilus assembly protein PilE
VRRTLAKQGISLARLMSVVVVVTVLVVIALSLSL